ncbi:hypothetical protein [Bacillus mobilis]
MSLAQRLIEDPKIAAGIRRLVEQTGIPMERYVEWLESDPPHGITRADWLDALASTADAPLFSDEVMERLRYITAPSRRASAA